MARICVFDVNETLLDLQALDLHFERAFGDAAVRKVWFTQFIKAAFVATIISDYHDFGKVGGAALDMTLAITGKTISADDRQSILGTVRELPPHPEVRESFERLKAAGIRMAALTNSTAAVAQAQLTNAGLADYLEQMLSADAVQRLKPSPQPYHYAAQQLGVSIDQIRLIAAHDWDVAGAMRAGAAAAFVARPGMVLNPLFPAPDIVGADLREVVDNILIAEKEVPGR
jgi:2-haloacid dehalogenase